MYQNYQRRVLGPTEIVYYDQIVMTSYRPRDIWSEPFIGVKVLLRDNLAWEYNQHPSKRLADIDAFVSRVLVNSGCIVREAKVSIIPDGLWLIGLPVPRSQLATQMRRLTRVIQAFEAHMNVSMTGLYEISISGQCTESELCMRLRNIVMTPDYNQMMIKPAENQFDAYNFGCVIPINDKYLLIRTRWYNQHIEMMPNLNERIATIIENVDYVTLKLTSVFNFH